MGIAGRIAVLTGGARGIGRSTALAFMQAGARVVAADFDQQAGEALGQELSESGGMFYQVDVVDAAQTRAMADYIVNKYGRIDILINNAGITRDGLLTKVSDEAWEQVLAVNLTGVFNCTKAVAPLMMQQGYGRIINVSSVVGIYGNIGQTNYAASKAGVIGMTKTWAKELAPKGITVNAVAPGFIATDMTAKVPQKILELMQQKTPVGRLGQPEDIARAYLFLAADEASFINGVVLSVDGGLVL